MPNSAPEKIKAAIFDADGVSILAPELFSQVYAKERGLQPADFVPFFKGEFQEALVGRGDLKDLIVKRNDLWHWEGEPELLLQQWFKTEDYPNDELLAIIHKLRIGGLPVFLATNQEKYRTKYFREEMFKGVFDDIFSSSEVGYTKDNPKFWSKILEALTSTIPNIKPGNVLYFDDDQSCLDQAIAAGISAHLFEGTNQVSGYFHDFIVG